MALITTPGAVTADAYVSLADAALYAEARGLTFAITGDDEELAEQAIRRATAWIDGTYFARFPGSPTSVDQALEWPRTGVVFRGQSLADDIIPGQIVRATVEAAVREKVAPNSLNPDVIPGQNVKRERIEGVVEVEYAGASTSVTDQQPVIAVIDGILAPLLGGSAIGNTSTSMVQRA